MVTSGHAGSVSGLICSETRGKPLFSWKLLCPPATGLQHELQRFPVSFLPNCTARPHPSAPKSCSREGREATERSHSGWMTSLWSGLVGKAQIDGDEVGEFGWWWGQGVLQRRGPDRVQSEAEGHPDDQNHTAQTQEAGRLSQTGLPQGHGERFGCWTRDREEACGGDATVNVRRLAEVTVIRRAQDDPPNRAERQRRFIQR